MTADCPDCGRPLAHVRIGTGACYDCNIQVPLVQCEDCGDWVTEDAAEFTNPPGATLAWCTACYTPWREV